LYGGGWDMFTATTFKSGCQIIFNQNLKEVQPLRGEADNTILRTRRLFLAVFL
jgi:hypothetical protein